MLPTLKISECFYSLQGEGGRVGEPSLFVRLSGCSAKHACYASGVMCDTEFESGKETTLPQLRDKLVKLSRDCQWIIWTGGEPLDQLNETIVLYFGELGYKQALETSGIKRLPPDLGIDYVCVSPKVAEHVLLKNFEKSSVNELRYVRHSGQELPAPSLTAQHYFLSPHFDGWNLNDENVKHCIKLCLENPKWKLSLQLHKLLNIL